MKLLTPVSCDEASDRFSEDSVQPRADFIEFSFKSNVNGHFACISARLSSVQREETSHRKMKCHLRPTCVLF
jgi:hypothetical protein